MAARIGLLMECAWLSVSDIDLYTRLQIGGLFSFICEVVGGWWRSKDSAFLRSEKERDRQTDKTRVSLPESKRIRYVEFRMMLSHHPLLYIQGFILR